MSTYPPPHLATDAVLTLQVAEYLLQAGLASMEGVVFLDEHDRKAILLRAGTAAAPKMIAGDVIAVVAVTRCAHAADCWLQASVTSCCSELGHLGHQPSFAGRRHVCPDSPAPTPLPVAAIKLSSLAALLPETAKRLGKLFAPRFVDASLHRLKASAPRRLRSGACPSLYFLRPGLCENVQMLQSASANVCNIQCVRLIVSDSLCQAHRVRLLMSDSLR
eukprot:3123138-Pleurochrysis_carterae.AAC.1